MNTNWTKEEEQLVQKAFEFAKRVHAGQFRKFSKRDYIVHPISVSNILKKAGFSPYVVAAGFLHDTVEDTDTTMEDILREFGPEVTRFVQFNTEDKELTWEQRKIHTIKSLAPATVEERAVVVADKLDNLRQVMSDVAIAGEEAWKVFKRGKEYQAGYFLGVAEQALVGLSQEEIPPFFFELQKEASEFFEQHDVKPIALV